MLYPVYHRSYLLQRPYKWNIYIYIVERQLILLQLVFAPNCFTVLLMATMTINSSLPLTASLCCWCLMTISSSLPLTASLCCWWLQWLSTHLCPWLLHCAADAYNDYQLLFAPDCFTVLLMHKDYQLIFAPDCFTVLLMHTVTINSSLPPTASLCCWCLQWVSYSMPIQCMCASFENDAIMA